MNYEFTLHALAQIKLRSIPLDLIDQVIRNPEQIIKEEEVDIHQSILTFDDGKKYLLRVFLSKDKVLRVVITVYKTTQFKKYWQ